ncbi:MAG TPA: GTPase Era [Piscirickettsiaceae bacterium]|nr:GTPase Era [Piscirickettsiaceae bacterium]HIQ40260.1 GTPase Era [Sulfurivirga caldicuralii]
MQQDNQPSCEAFRAGFVSMIGRPNVGKSTLVNELIGQKITITAPRPQTTRHRIHAIKSTSCYQIVLVDTPGLHQGIRKSLNRYMNRAAKSALVDVDAVVFVVEANKWTREDEAVARLLSDVKVPIIVAINKVDRVKAKYDLLPFIEKVANKVKAKAVVPVSAYRKINLDALEQEIVACLPEQPAIFPQDYVTDRPTRFLVAEIIREKLMRYLGDEVPYGTTVEVEQMQWDEAAQRWVIHATIMVERTGQKAIVIGEDGRLIKKIGTEARQDIINLLDARVHLELWVKVKSNWSDDDRALASLGYNEV